MWWRKLPTLPSASTAPCSAASMRPPGAIGTGGTLGPSRWVPREILTCIIVPALDTAGRSAVQPRDAGRRRLALLICLPSSSRVGRFDWADRYIACRFACRSGLLWVCLPAPVLVGVPSGLESQGRQGRLSSPAPPLALGSHLVAVPMVASALTARSLGWDCQSSHCSLLFSSAMPLCTNACQMLHACSSLMVAIQYVVHPLQPLALQTEALNRLSCHCLQAASCSDGSTAPLCVDDTRPSAM